MFAQDVATPSSYTGIGMLAGASSHPPLSSIAERRSGSGEDTEDEEEDEDGFKAADPKAKALPRGSVDETVIKTGYLWKKGERRKTWKKRWFVLRPAHLAYYKTSAEYKLLRLIELSDIHSCALVALKKHENTFVLVSQSRTYYLQAQSQSEVDGWISAIEEARTTLMATSTQTSITSPIPIPTSRQPSSRPFPITTVTPSPPNALHTHPSHHQNVTSSDSDEASPTVQRTISMSSQQQQGMPASTFGAASPNSKSPPVDPTKMILSGYLMKCDSKRRNWRKRWFVLTGQKLMYSGSHMDTKPHRQFAFDQIVDALEYNLPVRGSNLMSPSSTTPSSFNSAMPDALDADSHTFKIVTTKRSLLLCAPTEDDEIKWLGAVRALIARRSVTHEPGPIQASSSGGSTSAGPIPAATSSGAIGGSGGVSATGIKAKVRRLSSTSASGAGGPEKGVS
ncbi:hypothetical protein ONZ45_g3943 [Pleurotus djamor]|nr:hypothetical protein ONZ45_g3943 [Pleurotus djamor]